MKSFVATMCVFMLGIVSFGTAMAGVVEESGNTDPDTFYDSLDESGDEIYLENGGTTLVFDKVTGNLTYWSDASGAVLADTPSGESKSAADTATDSPEPLLLDAGTNRSECDIWGGQEVEEQPILIDVINWNGDCNPFALYLYNGTNGWGGPLDYITDPPEVFHPMAYGTTYSSSWNGSWLHHTWSVYFMLENHGHHLGAEFDKPLGNVPALIETNDENYPLFTVEAEVLVQLDGTVRWRNIEVVWDNGGEEYQPALERFGVYGVQYPIIRGFDTGHAYAPGANQDYLVAPIKDGLLLNNPLYNIWNPVPDGHKGTDFENMEPRRWGDQIELKEKEDSPGIINTWVRNYPDGYHLTMPFL
ncbi:MAG: hypothetical protein KJ042_02005, partial [Deltaproteobacteria bacterium]|nr:hypothetical protein [Deltaproteobacteria bacterium]